MKCRGAFADLHEEALLTPVSVGLAIDGIDGVVDVSTKLALSGRQQRDTQACPMLRNLGSRAILYL